MARRKVQREIEAIAQLESACVEYMHTLASRAECMEAAAMAGAEHGEVLSIAVGLRLAQSDFAEIIGRVVTNADQTKPSH